MRRFFVIAGWEFIHHFKTRRFLLATFVVPVFLGAIIIIPSLYYESTQSNRDQVIGCVEFDTLNYCQILSERLALSFDNRAASRVLLQPILPDTNAGMRQKVIDLAVAKHVLDSLEKGYTKIKDRRRYLFQRPSSAAKERQLGQTYDEMIATRERRDLAEITYQKLHQSVDSLVKENVLDKADSLLRIKRLAGYVVIDGRKFRNGFVEFHSNQAMNFLRIQPLEHALQVMLVEERMREDGVTFTKMQEFLNPVIIQEFLVEGQGKREFKVMTTYLAPVIVLIFLFMALYTTTGFLFASIVLEKSNRVLEILISSTNSFQLIGGKFLGIGLLGTLQILIWMVLTAFFVFVNLIPTTDITFLTLENAGIFYLYFVLAYLLFGAMFVAIASIANNSLGAHHLAQLVRVLLISPVIFAAFVLLSPNALTIRFLSFIPFFSPAFMILRTPMSELPIMDYYISTGLMVVAIILVFFFAGKIFRIASLIHHRDYSFRSMMDLLKTK